MDATTRGNPEFFWNLQDMLDFLKHPSEVVQEWAASHILDMYPEAADSVTGVIPNVSRKTASSLLNELEGASFPISDEGSLRKIFQREERPYQKALAAALLIRNGFAVPDDELAGIELDNVYNVLAETDQGFDYLLDLYREDEELGEITDSIAHAFGWDILFHSLEDLGSKDRRKFIKDLERFWKVDLPSTNNVVNLDEASKLLSEALDATVVNSEFADSFAPTLVSELRKDRERIAAILKAAEYRKAGGMPWCDSDIHLLIACALALHRDSAFLKVFSATPDINEFWRALTLRPWRARNVDDRLAGFLANQKPESVLSTLGQFLRAKHGRFAYPLFVIVAVNVSGHGEFLDDAMDGKGGDYVTDDAYDAQRSIMKNPAAMDAMLDYWEDNPPDGLRAMVLQERPTQGVTQFLLNKFDHYMSSPNSRYYIEAASETGHPDFLPLMLNEWREGEVHLAHAIHLLVELNEVERDEHIQRIIQESEEATEEFREVLDDDSGGIEVLERRLRDKSLKIPLYCTECKRTYRYDLQQIFVSDNIRRSPIIGQVIECKGCGSLETYEQTDETKSIMSLEMVRAMTLDRSGVEDWREHTSIKFGPVAITVLGKKFDNRPEAYRYLLAELEKAPDNPDLNRRMGNIYSHGLRTDLALPYYEKAIRLNPEDMESVASIAQIHIDDERFADAIPYVESLASLCKAPEIDEDEAAEYFGPLLLYAKEIEENTGRRIRIFDTPGGELDISAISRDTGLQFVSFDLDDPNDYQLAFHTFRDGAVPRKVMDQWKRARSRAGAARSSSENPRLSLPAQEPIRKVKVGRNESCPCGSGKKYKRCCGR